MEQRQESRIKGQGETQLSVKNMLYVADIVENAIVDGEGFRTSLYLSGCDICCEGCHNKSLWDINSGKAMTVDEVYDKVISYFTNITFIGGEPMLQSPSLTVLAKKIKENTNKTIWLYSGHTYEEIIDNKIYFSLLKYCDVLVDGRFDENYYKSNLKFKGSTNQRIINVKNSLANKEVILWENEF